MKNHRKILLVNNGYIPLRIIDVPRAYILICGGKAEVIHNYDDVVLRTSKKSFPHPSVIRLFKWVEPHYTQLRLNHTNLFKRDKHTCVYCGVNAKKTRGVQLTMDHVVPRALGGATIWDNVATACRNCNVRKADKPLDMLDNAEFPVPTCFKPNFLMLTSGMRNVPEAWKNYLLYSA